LQAFSGHRDTRMLLRYTHLCMPSLAKRLDKAFADQAQTTNHHGRRRLAKGASISMEDICSTAVTARVDAGDTGAEPQEPDVDVSPLPDNVVPFRRPSED